PEIPGVEGEPRANRRGLRLSGRVEHWPAARHEHGGHCCYRPELLQTNATTRDATHAHPPEPAGSANRHFLIWKLLRGNDEPARLIDSRRDSRTKWSLMV